MPPGLADQPSLSPTAPPSPWLRLREACRYTGCGRRSVLAAVRAGQLRAARVGGRRELHFRASWLDGWLEGLAGGGRP